MKEALFMPVPNDMENDLPAIEHRGRSACPMADSLSPLVATSKIFSRASKRMTLKEWKTFVFALTHLRWKKGENSPVVKMDKYELADALGISPDDHHLAANIYREIRYIVSHSFLEVCMRDKNRIRSGDFLDYLEYDLNDGCFYLAFKEYYMELFQGLSQNAEYITMWGNDVFQMSSEYSVLMYENLRLNSDTRKENVRVYSTKELKKLFGMPSTPDEGRGSYMHFSKTKNRYVFDRANFEKYVLSPVIKDINKSKMIRMEAYEDGLYWKKEKAFGSYVTGYEFKWRVEPFPGQVAEKPENMEPGMSDGSDSPASDYVVGQPLETFELPEGFPDVVPFDGLGGLGPVDFPENELEYH